jgi:hypothetical protein
MKRTSPVMRYRLVEYIDGEWFSFEGDNIEQLAKGRGYERERTHYSSHTLAELQGQPTFKGLHGPCDREPIRYENWAACDLLSR